MFAQLKPKLEDLTSVAVIILEQLVSCITWILPESLIGFFTSMVKFIFSLYASSNPLYNRYLKGYDLQTDTLLGKIERLREAQCFEELCAIHGFKAQSHLVQTKDGYLLTVHRLDPHENGYRPNGKIVYFQHGLLMNSEIWVLMADTRQNLPFRLCELGYDVYLGNNRGNKYSARHVSLSVDDTAFWDFSIDQFALFDIPASINHILEINGASQLIYIGFSQGCSQILASISVNHALNMKISKLVLISPATTPKKLSNWLINSIVNFQPALIYLLFGRKILLKSVLFWKDITYPPFFSKVIDLSNKILFDWKSLNIDPIQKFICYFHLYSTTSVKSVVHWFQIIKSKRFQMYQESDMFPSFEYPIHTNIKLSKILLIYGMADSLVDIQQMTEQLPEFEEYNISVLNDQQTKPELVEMVDNEKVDETMNSSDGEKLQIVGVENYEHLDLVWGQNIEYYVINNVLEFLSD
ncbi:hypothetical protein KL930_001813 [Ogataea haglerorum]|uniref:AB hydrolase-1 domain-containing protein n=1 Tax=Ogataea haglerorum TaxID=1937702 RepID=A0ABQ7RKA7_9ASCO|nr:hypothetical protein KL914_002098 [Ogataea haglerorum]KAG7744438.1 hypothetical protein KL932_000954 [Ogataea haglerorum]KAG7760379.1 hypothetical protein KL947_001223 [Ogataea haglerorum]KAG7767302.1 hypothetical protein KL946_001401 [Ogataea haglerorum]KAG7775157.1 hypothetical protein KL922_004405 [Ogataea haglerorum]